MKVRIVFLLISFVSFTNALAQIKTIKNPIKVELNAPMSEKQLDSLVQLTLKTFDVPGISLGIVKNGETIYAKGHGVRSLGDKQTMNEHTLVGIASNSKGFTCTALAILADEGKLDWDDKVIKHIPEFKMYDSYLTKEVTVRDLVSHRAGLGLGQGDLMFFPEGGKLKIQDIVERVQYLKPEHSFRNTLDYNNIMFIIAGEVITRVSGLSWAEFIEKKILKPVGMTNSYGSYNRALQQGVTNRIAPHAPVEGVITQVPHDWNETANAAGGIVSTIPDMLKWANCLMNDFKTESGHQLVSKKQILQLWQIQQPITMSQPNAYDSHFYGYGLGWFLSDVKGYLQVQHTGGLIGTVTQFTLIPDLDLGIVVLTNQQSGAAFSAITNAIKDAYLGIENRNWVGKYAERMLGYHQRVFEEKGKIWKKSDAFQPTEQTLTFDQIKGTYQDQWFGNLIIRKEGKKWRVNCENSPRLKGELFPYDDKTMIIKWDDRSYDADVFITFNTSEKGKITHVDLKPISSVTDFSFDFEDLHLKKKQ